MSRLCLSARGLLLMPLAVVWACRAHALVVYAGGQDETAHNTTAAGMPSGLDAVWGAVVSVSRVSQAFNASAVYLGGGFFLTAKHVDALDASWPQVAVNAAAYTLDARFGTGGILNVEDIPGVVGPVDLKLFRVLSPPALPAAALNRAWADTDVAAYVVGCGKGKGAAVAGQGWAWGADSTRAPRWGLARTVGQDTLEPLGACLVSAFSAADGADAASAAVGDSGGGLFQRVCGAWVLSGVTAAVTTSGYSYYNKGGVSPEEPDMTAYVRVAEYADAILSAISDITVGGVAVPGLWLRAHFPSVPFDGYAALAGQAAANGANTVAECYVAGLDPTDAASRFRAVITFQQGAPQIAWSPDLGAERLYQVQGKADLSETAWAPTNTTTRFFKVTVKMR